MKRDYAELSEPEEERMPEPTPDALAVARAVALLTNGGKFFGDCEAKAAERIEAYGDAREHLGRGGLCSKHQGERFEHAMCPVCDVENEIRVTDIYRDKAVEAIRSLAFSAEQNEWYAKRCQWYQAERDRLREVIQYVIDLSLVERLDELDHDRLTAALGEKEEC